MEKKKGFLQVKLNSIEKIPNDPTCLKATFIILDFNVSGNKDVVSKELALSASKTLNGKPLLAKYYPVTEANTPTDHLGTHEERETKDRYGNDIVVTDTIAIGTGITDGYIMIIKDSDGNDKEVLACDYKLWYARYTDAIDLILEWYNRGININSSCEYYFMNFTMQDGVCYIKEPLWFDGHVVLNSEERNSYPIVEPAYEDSKLISLSINDKTKWNKIMCKTIEKNKEIKNNHQNQIIDDKNKKNENIKEDNSMGEENKKFKKVCELSFDDIYTLLYGQLKAVLSDDEYYDSWITDTYETYFILSYWSDDTHKYYKISYTKVNDSIVTIDWTNRTEMYLFKEWREISEVQNELNSLKDKIQQLTNSLNTKTNELTDKDKIINTLTTDKNSLSNKLDKATNSIAELSKNISEMKPVVDKFNKEEIEKEVNEKKAYYENKFKAVNALEKFNSEKVQKLVKFTINENEEGINAKNSLNSMITDAVSVKNEEKNIDIKELPKSNNNLIDENLSFDKRYGFVD